MTLTVPARRHAPVRAALLLLCIGAALHPSSAPTQEAEPAGSPLVYLRDIDGSILQDMRYAGPNNFTGRRVPGYGAAECMLLRDVADALSRVQQSLAGRNLSLRVYDCYRPRRAVRAFEAWAKDPGGDPLLKRFHPNLEKNQLFDLGYIASISGHSRGDTVDLTLVSLPARKTAAFKADAPYGSCAGPAEVRAPDAGVDMGTGFDCFDPLSHTKAAEISPEQRRWRQLLVDAMARQGFRNYHKEWWHFTYMPERRGRTFDVPILRRPR